MATWRADLILIISVAALELALRDLALFIRVTEVVAVLWH